VTATRISVRLTPRGGRDAIEGWDGDVLRARVSAPAADGRANDALVRLLAETLDVPRRDVEIVSGHGARDKIVALAGIGPDEIERRLASATVGAGKERD